MNLSEVACNNIQVPEGTSAEVCRQHFLKLGPCTGYLSEGKSAF